MKFDEYTYEELKYIVDNLHKMIFDTNEIIMTNYFNKLKPSIDGCLISKLKHFYIIKMREQKINEILK